MDSFTVFSIFVVLVLTNIVSLYPKYIKVIYHIMFTLKTYRLMIVYAYLTKPSILVKKLVCRSDHFDFELCNFSLWINFAFSGSYNSF